MNHLAIILVLSSCVTHAAWNLLSKRSSKSVAFFWYTIVSVTALAMPLFILLDGFRFCAAIPARHWLLLILSSGFMAGYMACLAVAYRHGDVSVAYPVIRTTPIFVLLLAGLLLHQIPSPLAVVGILLVVAGCFVLPVKRFEMGPEGFHFGAYLNRSNLWALGAALGSSGYTLIDDVNMDALEALPALASVTGPVRAFLYQYLQYVCITLILLPAALIVDRPAGLRRVARREWASATIVGLMVFGSYGLILWAYANADKVAYVAGLRQLSIVLGVIGGMVFYREQGGLSRVVASVVIVAGLIMIGLSR